MTTRYGMIHIAASFVVCALLIAAPPRISAAEPRIQVAPAIYRSSDAGRQPSTRLVQFPVANYGSRWGRSGGYGGYGGYSNSSGYGWGGYGGPGGYVSYPAYSWPLPSSGIPVYSAYPAYGGYPMYTTTYPSYWSGYSYPIYSAGSPGTYGYTYGPR